MEDKNKILALAVAVITAAVAAWIITGTNKPVESTSEQPVVRAELHKDYAGLPEDNLIVQKSAGETIDVFKQGTGIVFLGFKECPWCQELLPLLNQAAEAESYADAHYLDIKQARDDKSADYQQLVQILAPYLNKDDSGQLRIAVPDVSVVKDGEIIWRFEMEATTEAERTPETYWTEDRRARAVQNFRDQIKKLKETNNEGL